MSSTSSRISQPCYLYRFRSVGQQDTNAASHPNRGTHSSTDTNGLRYRGWHFPFPSLTTLPFLSSQSPLCRHASSIPISRIHRIDSQSSSLAATPAATRSMTETVTQTQIDHPEVVHRHQSNDAPVVVVPAPTIGGTFVLHGSIKAGTSQLLCLSSFH